MKHKHDGENEHCLICRMTKTRRLMANAIEGIDAAGIVLERAYALLKPPGSNEEEYEWKKKRRGPYNLSPEERERRRELGRRLGTGKLGGRKGKPKGTTNE